VTTSARANYDPITRSIAIHIVFGYFHGANTGLMRLTAPHPPGAVALIYIVILLPLQPAATTATVLANRRLSFDG